MDEKPQKRCRRTVLKIVLLLMVAAVMFGCEELLRSRINRVKHQQYQHKDFPGQAQFLQSSSALCSSHPKRAGLDGECCPVSDGLVLLCCDQKHVVHTHASQRRRITDAKLLMNIPANQVPQRIINHRVIPKWEVAKDDSKMLHRQTETGLRFEVYSEEFYSLFFGRQLLEVNNPLLTKDFAFAHEGPVYLKETNEVFFVSNRMKGNTTLKADDWDDLTNQSVKLYAIHLDTGVLREIKSDIVMANGATINCSSSEVIVFSQGIGDWKVPETFTPSGIHRLNPYTGQSSVLLNNVFGLPFNSLNDVVMTRSGTLWFTDPVYGYQQGFLNATPALPNAIWALSPADAGPRIIQMHSLSRPNGLAVSPAEDKIYVTDTGYALGDMESRTVYEHIIENVASGTPTFRAATPLYYAEDGVPDGIKTDERGNIYLAQGDGVAVISSRGLILGKILMPRGHGATQLVFGGPDFDQLVVLAEHPVWVVPMAVRAAPLLRC